MRNTKKIISLLAMLLLAVGLTGCGSSSSGNTGIWIAVTVMVFIAVFSATSGVVYLVLQKLLPPEKPKGKIRRAEEYDYDDLEPEKSAPPRPSISAQRRPAANPQPHQATQAPGNSRSGDIWICPRDRNRNTGPYCAVCGGKRPEAPKANPVPQRPQNAPSRPVPRQQTNTRQPGAFAARAQQPEPDQTYQQMSAQPLQTTQQPEREYRGKFARRESVQLPVEEPEVDSELLAAIFREAAENPEE